ncbi:hypothetical protein J2S49_000719 [Arcanobacterium wilhelmae]|uniref:Uncharacterized protein n=1 Tax=Arcanobacterium wilhelmae TaxID=1803177 RepID=A0ABT9NAV3_9ACTO|nr:hypothetical protein [Arcanobacterium wilhelmae]
MKSPGGDPPQTRSVEPNEMGSDGFRTDQEAPENHQHLSIDPTPAFTIAFNRGHFSRKTSTHRKAPQYETHEEEQEIGAFMVRGHDIFSRITPHTPASSHIMVHGNRMALEWGERRTPRILLVVLRTTRLLSVLARSSQMERTPRELTLPPSDLLHRRGKVGYAGSVYPLATARIEVSQVLFRLSRWENLDYAKEV